MDNPDMTKYIRRIWVTLVVLFVLVIASLIVTFSQEKSSPTVKNYIGKDGENGQTVQGPQGVAGYTPVKGVDYFDGKDGVKGETGSASTVPGPAGPPGESVQGEQGPTGTTGQDGKTPELRCDKNSLQWRYIGDEDWQVLQENSKGCQT